MKLYEIKFERIERGLRCHWRYLPFNNSYLVTRNSGHT